VECDFNASLQWRATSWRVIVSLSNEPRRGCPEAVTIEPQGNVALRLSAADRHDIECHHAKRKPSHDHTIDSIADAMLRYKNSSNLYVSNGAVGRRFRLIQRSP
jgi:hypothetical protein